ncbi:R3H domain-containing protein 4 [Rhynchospora pubera]|uniref:R3H domain-containing protein 4 n=1 Tax=Rhynchospora pubera TaxID=906938 RepID=A0AAV8E3C6_9POAL|nr:R3H domain-containing protein 4 [Rhynchospora pubera]
MSISSNGHLQDDTVGGEDSDIESDFATAAAESGTNYYHPISSDNGSFSESESEPDPDDLNTSSTYLNLSPVNGNGISSLDLNSDEEETKEEEEEEVVRESEASISRAFREDEQRRNTPLSAETSERIMDLMRGIEFRGAPPVWVDRVSEEQWTDQIRRIRGETQTAAGSSS